MSRLPDPGFWKGKRVLLTGHTGFKGSWAALWLTRLGAEVTGFSLAPEGPDSHFVLADAGRDVHHMVGDLGDPASVGQAVVVAQPDLVLHMAAQAILRRAVRDPVGTYQTNVMGTVNLLGALREHAPAAPALVITSDKVYRNDDNGRAFVEGDPLGGKDPYSASKAACELVVHSWRQTYGQAALATVRGGNVIGGGDFGEDRIIPDIVRAARAGEAVRLRHPNAVRPWQHVLDCLCGYLVYLEALSEGCTTHALNIGPRPEPATTVGEVTEAITQVLGAKPFVHEPVDQSVEVKLLALDSSLARQTLGWADRLSRAEALGWTADWYRGFLAGADMADLSRKQIDAYCASTQ